MGGEGYDADARGWGDVGRGVGAGVRDAGRCGAAGEGDGVDAGGGGRVEPARAADVPGVEGPAVHRGQGERGFTERAH